MTTVVYYQLWHNGQFHIFQSEQDALDEKLYMELMYNISPPLERVEEQYVGEQRVATHVTRR